MIYSSHEKQKTGDTTTGFMAKNKYYSFISTVIVRDQKESPFFLHLLFLKFEIT